jgi:DNA repair protein RadC
MRGRASQRTEPVPDPQLALTDAAREPGAAAIEPVYVAIERPPLPRLLRPIRGPDDVEDVCRGLLRRRHEEFHTLLLNARHEVQRRCLVSRGSLNASIVHPREVFRPAILGAAASIILVHNHPSGDPEPSEEDLSITRRLVQVGELVGIAVLDHVILAESGFASLRARGLL